VNREAGSSLSGAMYTLDSLALKELATTPVATLTVKYTSLMGPRTSSICPICDLFSR